MNFELSCIKGVCCKWATLNSQNCIFFNFFFMVQLYLCLVIAMCLAREMMHSLAWSVTLIDDLLIGCEHNAYLGVYSSSAILYFVQYFYCCYVVCVERFSWSEMVSLASRTDAWSQDHLIYIWTVDHWTNSWSLILPVLVVASYLRDMYSFHWDLLQISFLKFLKPS